MASKDPGAQPRWEAYALYLSVAHWFPQLKYHLGQLVFRGDAQGVLQSIVYRRARDAHLNCIVAEISLWLSGGMHDVVAAHWWSERNHICDRLSRLHEGETVPEELQDKPRAFPIRPRWRLYYSAL